MKRRKIYLAVSGILVGGAITAILVFGLNFGIDFTGGSLLEVRFFSRQPTAADLRNALAGLELGSLTVQPLGEDGAIIRFQETSEDKHQAVLEKISEFLGQEGAAGATTTAGLAEKPEENDGGGSLFEELRYDSVGPSIGQELKQQAIYAITLVILAIIIYIAWAFRKVSKPVASWKYGIAATVALFHDVFITIGIFAVLGRIWGLEINTPFVAAILTVLGYSVNDTIVVFDRIRENLPKSDDDFETTVNMSVNQTIGRSIFTSFTTLMVLVSILIFGGATIRDFVLALSIGIFIGTYSSIFVASPLLVIWEKWRTRRA